MKFVSAVNGQAAPLRDLLLLVLDVVVVAGELLGVERFVVDAVMATVTTMAATIDQRIGMKSDRNMSWITSIVFKLFPISRCRIYESRFNSERQPWRLCSDDRVAPSTKFFSLFRGRTNRNNLVHCACYQVTLRISSERM